MNISTLRTIGNSYLFTESPKSGVFAVITITDLIVIMLTNYKSSYDPLVEDLYVVLKCLTSNISQVVTFTNWFAS